MIEKDELLGELMEYVQSSFSYVDFLDYMEEKGYVKEGLDADWDRIQEEL